MFALVCCQLSVCVYCLQCVVHCLLFRVWFAVLVLCLVLLVVRCLLFMVRRLSRVVSFRCVSFAVRCLLFVDVCCRLLLIVRLLFVGCSRLSL